MRFVLTAIIVVSLFIIGHLGHDLFYTQSTAMLRLEDVELGERTLGQIKSGSIIFGVSLASIPLCYLLVLKASQLTSKAKHVITIVTILLAGIVFWRLRIFGINAEIEQLLEYRLSLSPKPTLDISQLKFEVYLSMGFIVGALIALLLFRNRSTPLIN